MSSAGQQQSGEAGNPFKITVTEWTVGFNKDDGNLVAQCKLAPEAGVTIYSASIGIFVNDEKQTPIVFGGAGNNGQTGEWFAVCGTAPQAKGTTVLSTITGTASSSAYGFAFQRTFQL